MRVENQFSLAYQKNLFRLISNFKNNKKRSRENYSVFSKAAHNIQVLWLHSNHFHGLNYLWRIFFPLTVHHVNLESLYNEARKKKKEMEKKWTEDMGRH